MNCIENKIIQRYIDGEATSKEVSHIEKHLLDCNSCTEKMEHQRRLATGIKDALHQLADDKIIIPEFISPKHQTKNKKKISRRIIYTLSAACILFFVLMISKKKAPETMNDLTIIQSFEWDVDANQPITKQQFTINIIDGDGIITEYFID